MRISLTSLGFLAIIVMSMSCRNDFELNAPYDRIPVVYGMLDPSLDK
ncbi:MAG: hypothetical protein ACI86P_002429 [Flavobacteriales bacterium]|jgi:hypothetical protein